MSMATRDVIVPDEVTLSSGEKIKPENPLDPCPLCGSRPEEAPEGLYGINHKMIPGKNFGDAVWHFPHCWKCGYRPTENVDAIKQKNAMRAAFEEWYTGKVADDLAHPTVNFDNASPSQMAAMRAKLAELEVQLNQSSPVDSGGTGSNEAVVPKPGA